MSPSFARSLSDTHSDNTHSMEKQPKDFSSPYTLYSLFLFCLSSLWIISYYYSSRPSTSLCAPRVEVPWRFFRGASLPPGSPTRLKRALIVCVFFYGAVWKRGMHSSRHSNARGKAASRAGQTPQVVNALKSRVCKGVCVWGFVNVNVKWVCADWMVFTLFTSTFSLPIHSLYSLFFFLFLPVFAWNDFLLPPRKGPQSFFLVFYKPPPTVATAIIRSQVMQKCKKIRR